MRTDKRKTVVGLALLAFVLAGLAACQVEQSRGPAHMSYQDPKIHFADPGQFQREKK